MLSLELRKIVNRCCMCFIDGESVALVFHCPVARELWAMVLVWGKCEHVLSFSIFRGGTDSSMVRS